MVAWESQLQDGSGYGVSTQRYGRAFGATEQTPIDLKNAITLADADADAGAITVTLSVGYGVLSASAGSSPTSTRRRRRSP